MVEKKEGATMSCKNCDTDLICRLRDYGGDYKPTLQWQNFDGTAHYKTSDGKNFTCNIPEDDKTGQTRISTETPKTQGDTPRTTMSGAEFTLLAHLEQKLDTVLAELERIKDMVTPLFQKMVDEQIGRRNP